MKVHRVTLYIVDFDELGAIGVRETLENQNFPNHCISPNVLSVETADCGDWDDDHPLNKISTASAEVDKLFARQGQQ